MGFFSNTLKLLQGKKEGFISKDWVYRTDSEIIGAPITCTFENKHYVIFGTKDGRLVLLNDNSDVIWIYTIKNSATETEKIFLENEAATGIMASPAVYHPSNSEKPLILFGSDDCHLYCLDFSGKMKWRFKTRNVVRTTPLIWDINRNYENEIIFGSTDGSLYVLDRKGNKLGEFKARSGIESSPGIMPTHDVILFGSNDGYIYALNKELDPLWEYKTGGKITARPAVADITRDGLLEVLVGSEDGNLYVFDEDGALKWTFKTEGSISSEATVADINNDGRLEILFGCSDDKVYCLSYNGNKIWDFEADFWIVSSPIVMDINKDGKMEVVVGSYDSTLYILDAEGIYDLNYMPGIASVTQQTGHYNEVISSQVGDFSAKKIFEVKTEGMVIGADSQDDSIIIGTKNGKIEKFTYAK